VISFGCGFIVDRQIASRPEIQLVEPVDYVAASNQLTEVAALFAP
jgi:hypothetical protein